MPKFDLKIATSHTVHHPASAVVLHEPHLELDHRFEDAMKGIWALSEMASGHFGVVLGCLV